MKMRKLSQTTKQFFWKDETIFEENQAACKVVKFYILLAFSLISIVLLRALSIYSYLIKCQGKKIVCYGFMTQIMN